MEGKGKGREAKLRKKTTELLFMIQNMNIDKIELIKGREDEGEDTEKFVNFISSFQSSH